MTADQLRMIAPKCYYREEKTRE